MIVLTGLAFVGILVGLAVGILPGLGGAATLALMLPRPAFIDSYLMRRPWRMMSWSSTMSTR